MSLKPVFTLLDYPEISPDYEIDIFEMVLPLAKLEVNQDQTEEGSRCRHLEGEGAMPAHAPRAVHELLTCGSSAQSRSGFVWGSTYTPCPLWGPQSLVGFRKHTCEQRAM